MNHIKNQYRFIWLLLLLWPPFLIIFIIPTIISPGKQVARASIKLLNNARIHGLLREHSRRLHNCHKILPGEVVEVESVQYQLSIIVAAILMVFRVPREKCLNLSVAVGWGKWSSNGRWTFGSYLKRITSLIMSTVKFWKDWMEDSKNLSKTARQK